MRSRTTRLSGWCLLAALVATLSAAAGIGARATYGAHTSGDEPYYLMTAQVLAADGSLDIAAALEERAHTPYHEIPVDPQTTPLDDTGRRVSPHDPLLPLLLAPAMALPADVGWLAAKGLLALVAGALAGLTTWVAVARFGVRPATAGLVVAGLHGAMPLSAYGTQVYPEVPAALAAMAVVALATAPALHGRHAVGMVLAITALPWLSVKYVPVAAVLALLVGLRVWRGGARRAVLVGGAALAVAGVAYLLAHQALYGGWTVYAAGDHFVETGELGVVGLSPDHAGRTRRLVGLLVDGEFGLGAWTPAWLAAPAAIGWAHARRLPDRGLLLAPAAAGWATATWVALTMHGWWSPGRQVVVVLPLLVVLVAAAADDLLARGGHPALAAVGTVLAAGVTSWLWLAVEASTGRLALIVDFTATSGPVHRAMAAVMPDGRVGGAAADAGLLAWAAVLAATVAISMRAATSRVAPRTEGQTPDGVPEQGGGHEEGGGHVADLDPRAVAPAGRRP